VIRLSWRQFRSQAAVAVGLLIAIAVVFAATRGHLAHLYNVYDKAQAACVASTNCPGVSMSLGEVDKLLELVGTALVALPALLGAFWGAPLIAREFENGTQRLVWTQSVTRARWLSVKVVMVGLASVAVTGVLSVLVTWWSIPIDHSHVNRFSAGLFGERNLVPLGYAAFGFALGVAAGLLMRRTVPAMAVTLVVFLAVRLTFAYAIRANLIPPTHESLALDPSSMGYGSTNGGQATLMPNPPNLPNAWVYSTHIVDSSGHSLTSQLVATTCPSLQQPGSGGPPAGPGTRVREAVPVGARNALEECVTKISATYHEVVTYQPADRYWPFQFVETAVYVCLALAVVGWCFWWIRRRKS
jgi:hypothetical protein